MSVTPKIFYQKKQAYCIQITNKLKIILKETL